MTNAEKYKEEIRNESKNLTVKCAVYKVRQPHRSSCFGSCDDCKFDSIEWLVQEYEETPIDWNKVKPGTKVWVRNFDAEAWKLREFAMCHNEKIWCYGDGIHSEMHAWSCARLGEW